MWFYQACLFLLLLVVGAPACHTGWPARGTSVPSGATTAGPSSNRTLVLYDNTGPYAWLGELYATGASALVSHFGSVRAIPVTQYQTGELAHHRAAVYVGTVFDQPLPTAFLDDVLSGSRPVLWAGANIWQLVRRDPSFVTTYGFLPSRYERTAVQSILYKGVRLSRLPRNEAGIMGYATLDTRKATVLATALRADGSSWPWAVRSRGLTYVGEVPFAYASEADRYLAFCDLLFDVLAPDTPERHRALVRIEDIHPKTSPATIRTLTDVLSSRQVPFSLAVIPVYQDPHGVFNHGAAEAVRLRDAPEVVEALRYAMAHGGTLVMHGVSHQHAEQRNPYSAVSAADFEFYRAHIDASANVVLDGPVAEDSPHWAQARIDDGLGAFVEAGLARPEIFEYPHYAGSVVDSLSIAERFGTVYQRELYFPGLLAGRSPDYTHSLGLFYPFVVHDLYGWKVLPENLGHYVPVSYNNVPPRTPDQLIANARATRVVRDGVASFFFHPMYDVAILATIVEGIQREGYTFVRAESL